MAKGVRRFITPENASELSQLAAKARARQAARRLAAKRAGIPLQTSSKAHVNPSQTSVALATPGGTIDDDAPPVDPLDTENETPVRPPDAERRSEEESPPAHLGQVEQHGSRFGGKRHKTVTATRGRRFTFSAPGVLATVCVFLYKEQGWSKKDVYELVQWAEFVLFWHHIYPIKGLPSAGDTWINRFEDRLSEFVELICRTRLDVHRLTGVRGPRVLENLATRWQKISKNKKQIFIRELRNVLKLLGANLYRENHVGERVLDGPYTSGEGFAPAKQVPTRSKKRPLTEEEVKTVMQTPVDEGEGVGNNVCDAIDDTLLERMGRTVGILSRGDGREAMYVRETAGNESEGVADQRGGEEAAGDGSGAGGGREDGHGDETGEFATPAHRPPRGPDIGGICGRS